MDRRPAVSTGKGTAAFGAAAAIVLLASGCSSRHLPTPASAVVPPGCAAPSGPPADRGTPTARYLAIANVGNQQLETDFDRLDGPDQEHLAASRADLRDIAATEHLFDRCLLAIAFPPRTEAVARSLYTVNEARAELTTTAAGAASLPGLAGYEQQLKAANAPVEDAVTTIRKQLGLPPPETS